MSGSYPRCLHRRFYALDAPIIPDRAFCCASIRVIALLAFLAVVVCGGAVRVAAQDTAAQEASHRAEIIAHSPSDAAKVLFGRETTPATGPAQAIGAYERGCLEGGIALPADGPNWQVMRPSRNRAWGHPMLVAFLEQLARKLPSEAGWPGSSSATSRSRAAARC